MTQTKNLSQPDSLALGNTKASDRCRGYCFTLNNYSDSEYSALLNFCKKKDKYIIGKEVGKEKETPHLQGYFYSKNQVRWTTLKKLSPRAHWEACKGNMLSNYKYCFKEGDFVTNIDPEKDFKDKKIARTQRLLKKYEKITWKDWQQRCIDIIEGDIDERKIYWFWEETGNIGKSFMNKYLGLKYDAILCSGKKNDIFHQIFKHMHNKVKGQWIDNGKDPKLILVDCPRTSLGYMNYGALEECKNGCIFSGKFEGGTCYFDHPHIICFANEPPDTSTMSEDRWEIIEIYNPNKKKEKDEDEIFF